MKFKCRFCDHSTNRKDNLRRHENEKHKKKLKTCECGKQFTSSALSRHKQTCNKQLPSIDLSPFNISNDQIANVAEHTVKIKLATLKDGTVVSLSNDIQVGGYTFALNAIEPDGNTSTDTE